MNNNDNKWERDYTIEGEEPIKPSKHPKLKEFFSNYAYDSVKMFVDQIAIAIFGLVITLALGGTSEEGNSTAMYVASGISVIFYLFLIYIVGWQAGARDKLSIEYKKKKFRITTPLFISLLANSVNIIFAIVVTVGHFAGNDFGMVAAQLVQGMYSGLLSIPVSEGVALHNLWYMYYVIIIPSVLISLMSYTFGVKNWKLTNILTPQLPETDRPSKNEKKK